MKSTCVLLFLLLAYSFSYSQDPIEGLWTTIDDEDGQPSSIIKVEIRNNELTATIQELVSQPQDILCEKCSGKLYNQPIVGMQILSGLEQKGSKWSGGTILDPKNGKSFKCKIELSGPNKLKLRGYIGLPALGRTQYWERRLE